MADTIDSDKIKIEEKPIKKEGRKRRNRWGDAADTEETNETIVKTEETSEVNIPRSNSDIKLESTTTEDQTKRVRKSRFSANTTNSNSIPGITPISQAPLSEEVMQQIVVLKLHLQQISAKMLTVIQDAKIAENDPNRSPSPPPKYDSNGKRTNTREVRMREELMEERIKVIEEIMRLNPSFIPPPDFIKGKPVRRIFIPKQSNPLYNFIGLIIGPRGNTQKQMETETGCKISIRGKGSAKEGSKGRATKNVDDDQELHVHIQGETEESVEKAAKMIEEILNPKEENLEQHKQKQLRELALINGTLREDEYCPVCGEKGHRQFECPHRAKSFKAAGVKCAICGDLSHPTRDCPLKDDGPTNEVALDTEYDSFLAELGGKPTTSSSTGGNPGTKSSTGLNSKPSGPTYVAPIVDVMTKKQQTIIHVTTVMTGNAPPVFFNSNPSLTLPTSNFTPSTNSSFTTVPTAPTVPVAPVGNWVAPVVAPAVVAPFYPPVGAPSGLYAPGVGVNGGFYPPPVGFAPAPQAPGVPPPPQDPSID